KPNHPSVDGELWIPRTMWEKRRQLSGVLHRSVAAHQPLLVLSCDDHMTFLRRVELDTHASLIDYLQVSPLLGTPNTVTGTDLSRIMGPLGGKMGSSGLEYGGVLVDDVDLIIDLRSEESAVASMYALVYALKARFKEIFLFTNPLRSGWELE